MTTTSRHFFYPGEPVPDGQVRVTMLGTGTPFPRRGQAGTCMFVEAGEQKIFFDCGPGSSANFTALEIPFDLADKIILTHHHVDHIGDLGSLWIGGWTYGRRTPLRVWGPAGTENIVEHHRGIYEWDLATRTPFLKNLGGKEIEVQDYQDGVIFDEGGVTVSAFKVVHTDPQNSYGLKLEAFGRTLIFSGDTKKCDALIEQGQGADVIIHEAFPPTEIYAEKAGRPLELARTICEILHTSPSEAGAVFAATGPRLGVIFHMYNNDDLIGPALDDVRKTYDGKVIVGQDMMVIDIGEDILVRKAVVDDKPWPVAPAGVRIGGK